MISVALVVPLTTDIVQREDSTIPLEYLGHSYIASYLRNKEVKVDIIDSFLEKLSAKEVACKIKERCYDFVFFTMMSSDYLEMIKLILSNVDHIKFKIGIGGRDVTNKKESLFKELKHLDYILEGEGEYSTFELISGVDLKNIKGLIWKNDDGEIVTNKKRTLLNEDELDRLPFPSRDTISYVINNKYIKQASVLGSRGCQGNCYFCGVASYQNKQDGKRWRGRSPENIVKEIKQLVDKFNINYIYFIDDDFIGPGECNQIRAQEFSKQLIKENISIRFTIFTRVDVIKYDTFKLLKEAGLDNVFVGVEFGVDRLLKQYNKGINKQQIKESLKVIKDLKLNSSIGYITFEPTMTIDELKENIEFYFDNIEFRLKILLVQIAIYDNCEAYKYIKNLIDIDEYTTPNYMFGDIHSYRFKDKRVGIAFNIFNEHLQCISPSKYLHKIRRLKLDKESYKEECSKWSKGILEIIMRLIDKLKYKDWTNEEIKNISDNFRIELLEWDESK